MRYIATDNSVRDHPQQAMIDDDRITIISKVGRQVAGSYSFPLSEWYEANKFANPNYSRVKLIEKYTMYMDDEPGGFCQAGRIRDSQIYAIKLALEKQANSNPTVIKLSKEASQWESLAKSLGG